MSAFPQAEEKVAAAEVIELYMQYWLSSAVLAAANLGVADALGDSTSGVDELARALEVDAGALHRLLRGLASAGIFQETESRRFAHTPRSRALRRGAVGDARALIRMFGLKSTREAMVEYEYAIRSGRSAFERVHGSGNPFEVSGARPEEAAAYHEGMSSENQGAPLIVRQLDIGGVHTLVDVGGGRGVLLARLLQRHPQLRGVLFDLPEVIADAGPIMAERGVADRCELRAGDLRRDLPSGDGYVLKNILHGWSDDECRDLLRRIKASGAPGARVFIIENVMPAGNEPAPCKLFDLFLLTSGGRSRVRTAEEFRAMFESAGFRLGRVLRLFADHSIVEALPA